MKTSVIEVEGMLSALSSHGVEKRLGQIRGVHSATVNFAARDHRRRGGGADRIEGRPPCYKDPPAPAAGEIRFERTPVGWEMTSHKLTE